MHPRNGDDRVKPKLRGGYGIDVKDAFALACYAFGASQFVLRSSPG